LTKFEHQHSAEQAKGYSLPTQLEACRKYAESQGFEVAGAFRDDYSGATPIESRPEGRKAYEMLSHGRADVLVVYRMDRLVRPPEDGDEWDIPVLVRGLAKLGREIHTLDRGKLEASFAGLLIAVLDGKSAGDERRKIIERSTRGRRAKAQQKWVGSGYAPFGYRKLGKGREVRLELDEAQAAVVRRIFDIYLGLNGECRLGFDGIAQLLNEEGVACPNRKHSVKQKWNSSSIGAILANRDYIGQFTYSGETLSLPQLAIVEQGAFERAQAQRAQNFIESRRNTKHDYLLRSRLLCTCGRRMSCMWIHNHGKDYQYYQCNRKVFDGSEQCDRLKVRSDVADQVAWDWLSDVFKHPDKMRAGLADYAERQRNSTEPKRRRLVEVLGLLKDTEKQAARLAESIQSIQVEQEDDDEPSLAVKSLEAQLKQVSKAHQRYNAERDQLAAELDSEELSEAQQDQIMAWAAEINQGIEDGDVSFEAKRALVDRLRVTAKIEYQNGERGLRLTCVLDYAEAWRSLSPVSRQEVVVLRQAHPR
jgi:DNA invertase Pin-like site-specific DNA recombinase